MPRIGAYVGSIMNLSRNSSALDGLGRSLSVRRAGRYFLEDTGGQSPGNPSPQEATFT